MKTESLRKPRLWSNRKFKMPKPVSAKREDLTLSGPNSGYTFRLRDRKIRCRPLNASDDEVHVQPQKRTDL